LKQIAIGAELIPVLSNAKNSAQFINIEMNFNTAKVHFHHLFSSDFEELSNKVDAFIQFHTNVHQQYIKTIALDDNTWSQGEKDLAFQTFESILHK
jgi:hypothetical protein